MKPSDKPLCIYHGNCADGFTAAWAVNRFFAGECDFHAGVYQAPPPVVSGRHVILVDFSYKRVVLEEMAQSATSILVLDHHKSAAEDLAGYPTPPGPLEPQSIDPWGGWLPNEGVHALFDMNRAGCRIAWDYFFPGVTPPTLLLHIEDRDLWRFALPSTREIQANVFSYPYDFKVWDELMAADLSVLAREGAAIERKHHKDVAELTTVVTRFMIIGGHKVPIANLPYTLVSDAAHNLAQGQPFAGCYWDTPDGRVFGLRSAADGLDVSAIAKQYGGGGHQHAAGFKVPFEQAQQMECGA